MASYVEFYNLRDVPFGLTPDTTFFCDVECQRGALDNILTTLYNGDSFIKVTGEVGVGKTLLSRRLLDSLDQSFVNCYIYTSDLSAEELRLAIADELGISSNSLSQNQLLHSIKVKLTELHNDGKKVVLIIDEAQSLSDDALDAIRLITNLETKSTKLLQVVLFAQPELDERLCAEEFRHLLQRITKTIYLWPLSKSDMELYISHRLVSAGHPSGQLFTNRAKNMLYKSSQGIPRILNVLCGKSLLLSYQRGLPYVDLKEIKQSMQECDDMLKVSKISINSGWVWEVLLFCSIVLALALCWVLYNYSYLKLIN